MKSRNKIIVSILLIVIGIAIFILSEQPDETVGLKRLGNFGGTLVGGGIAFLLVTIFSKKNSHN